LSSAAACACRSALARKRKPSDENGHRRALAVLGDQLKQDRGELETSSRSVKNWWSD
jgi:hypothetical protein